ncbi:MAG: hypothetical protein JWN33_290 [Candidatus Saccharibacteria bacterium]|nr:hypothetical protein [Candidatus Saccharibacteria bacterium]
MNSSQNKLKKILFIVSGVVVVAIIAIATVMLLKNVATPKKDTSASAVNQSSAARTPAGIVAGYKDSTSLPSLAGYARQESAGVSSAVTLKKDSEEFSIDIETKNFITYFGKSDATAASFDEVAGDTATYLKERGLEKTTTSTRLATYASKDTVCQLRSTAGRANITFACTTVSDIDAEYAGIKQLIGLYNNSDPVTAVTAFTYATRTVNKRDNIQSAKLILRTDDVKAEPTILLFGAIGGVWEYVANLNGTGKSDGKNTISAVDQKAIDDKKWSGFLHEQL